MKEIIRRNTLDPGIGGRSGRPFVEVWATRRHHDYLRIIQLQGFHYNAYTVRPTSGLISLLPVDFYRLMGVENFVKI